MHGIWNNRYLERHRLAWHQLGKQGEPRSASEALEEVDGDFNVETVPMWYTSPTTGEIVMSDQVAIVRPAWHGEPEERYGYASAEFMPIQNREVCRLLDGIAQEWPVETIGLIRRGADLFVTLDAGTTTIAGDEVRLYMFVWNTHDATRSLKARVTPVRVVCQNTCIMGDAAAYLSIDVRHTRQVMTAAEFAFGAIATMRKQLDRSIENLSSLTRFKMTTDQVAEVVAGLYPVPEPKPSQTRLESVPADELSDEEKTRLINLQANLATKRLNAIQAQIKAWELFEKFNNDFPAMARTGWAVYNAITEFECWKDERTSEANIAQSILVGARGETMKRAFTAIAAVGRN